MSFLSIQLLNELLYHFYLAYSLLPFFITFSVLNSVFYNYFSKIAPAISPPLSSLITYVHGTAFLTYLIRKTFSDQFGVWPFVKIIVYPDILTIPPISNLGSIIKFITRVNIGVWLYINRFHFNCTMINIFIFVYCII